MAEVEGVAGELKGSRADLVLRWFLGVITIAVLVNLIPGLG